MTREDALLLSRIDERTERMSEQLDALEKYVFRGNGRPSLSSRVDGLEQRWKWAIALASAAGTVVVTAVELLTR